jgi:hypothetical protein
MLVEHVRDLSLASLGATTDDRLALVDLYVERTLAPLITPAPRRMTTGRCHWDSGPSWRICCGAATWRCSDR